MKCIVITTIFPPTRAVQDFSKREDWTLVVAGDRKTPADWACENVEFLSATAQENRDFKLSGILPWNHYCRKMTGYLEGIRLGAEIIVDTDDDNIPKSGWSFPEVAGTYETTADDLGFVNVYGAFTKMPIWPRGFPLERILLPEARAPRGDEKEARVGIWQGLADGDPDVDAIYRLTNNEPCNFDERAPIVLGQGTWCPFNSQNTMFVRELFPLLYLPAFVTFRFTDILRGLIAQPIMWAAGYRLGFTSATVVQERNPHDYLKDFQSEIPCYLHAQQVADTVTAAVKPNASIAENLYTAYEALLARDIVQQEEMQVLSAWLEDVAR